MTKAQRIQASLRATKVRRKTRRPMVIELKLQNLSKKQAADLNRVFLEAKWLYNWLLEDLQDRLRLDAGKVTQVQVKVKDAYETRRLVLLGSQVKQEIQGRLKDNLHSLAQLKKKGVHVGPLKFKPFVNSVPFKQYGKTHEIDLQRNKVKLQKLGWFRVLGLHQLPEGREIANALLVRKPSGFYLHLVVYVPKAGEAKPGSDNLRSDGQLGPVGVDLGIKTRSPCPTVCSSGTKSLFPSGSRDFNASSPGRRVRETTSTPAIS